MDVVEFGEELFASHDLDPVYVALQRSNLGRGQLAHWLVAYWLFYSVGFACYASEQPSSRFWRLMLLAATNATLTPFGARWPRGAERRHFRGRAAEVAVNQLHQRYPEPEMMLEWITSGPMDAASVVTRATDHPMFGPWVGFKIADMIDAVWEPGSVTQDDIGLFLYDSPRKAIDICYKEGALSQLPTPKMDRYEYALSWLGLQLKHCRIPHKPQAAPDWFSLETVWCKYGSHAHGYYPLGKDTRELHHGVRFWIPYSVTAKRFASGLPPLASDELLFL